MQLDHATRAPPFGATLMPTVTVALLALLAIYVGGWIAGLWPVTLAELLSLLTVVTGGYWFARWRRDRHLQGQGRRTESPWWLRLPADAFLPLAGVLLFRSFVFEPFAIPSESMVPTLEVADRILVNKFSFGLRLPVLDTMVLRLGAPERGDVIVFHSPVNPKEDWIKRVVGIPGDSVRYASQQLSVNGQWAVIPGHTAPAALRGEGELAEEAGGVVYRVHVNPLLTQDYRGFKGSFPFSELCDFGVGAMSCVVPAGHYFVMGDNRDHSLDSRVRGFVPAANLVGRASLVWMNLGNLSRIGMIR